MRSKASFRGHPIHPMLIPFPLALLMGALVADVAGRIWDNVDLHVTAWYMLAGGVVMGLVTAVPGLIDYVYTVPPKSSGKKRATRHLVVNVSAVALFAIVWWLRGGPGVSPDTVLLVLEALAAGLLGFGGWMGGTLAFRNQIGVDHRYARAGKWKEVHVAPSADWITVAGPDELEVDQMKLVRVGKERVVVARSGEGYVAFADHCTHRGGSLAGGVMACGIVTCPWHGSQFDVSSGKVAAGPAKDAIRTYPVEARADGIAIRARE